MDERDERHEQSAGRGEPGQPPEWKSGLVKPALGLAASIVLTLASFWAAGTQLVWGPGVPVLLAALAIGQMGVHLVFFLHVSSGPESTNTILALAFGVFVVALVVFGSLIIMAHLDAGMNACGMHGPPCRQALERTRAGAGDTAVERAPPAGRHWNPAVRRNGDTYGVPCC
jgi:cytochrome o ubiquinol oxidase operon protein cyoD